MIDEHNLKKFMLFRGSQIKPEKYETRNCYPKQSKEIFEAMERKLNELIQCKLFSLKKIRKKDFNIGYFVLINILYY